MHTRFITAVVAGLAGAVVVVASQAFAAGTTAWVAFGVGLGLLIVSGVPVLVRERGLAGLLLDGAGGALAIWTVIASVVFSGNLVRWLSFGEGAAFAALAVGGLVLNQVRLARQVHVAVPVGTNTSASDSVGTGRPSAVAA